MYVFVSYTLNTLVNPPHEDEVYSAVFRPSNKTSKYSHMVATTSKDGYIKTWVLQVGKDSQGDFSRENETKQG